MIPRAQVEQKYFDMLLSACLYPLPNLTEYILDDIKAVAKELADYELLNKPISYICVSSVFRYRWMNKK